MSTPLRFLITAGPTREYLDTVRYLSNDSSGKMGFAIARAATRRGHAVTLVHGPVALKPPGGVEAVAVVSAAEMFAACKRAWPGQDALIMAAAVADYAPVRRSRIKLKKAAGELTLALRPTVDILATLAGRRTVNQIAIGFALEDANARRNALGKFERKRLDAIILNRPTGIGADHSELVAFVAGAGWQAPRSGSKRLLGDYVIRLTERLCSFRICDPKSPPHDPD